MPHTFKTMVPWITNIYVAGNDSFGTERWPSITLLLCLGSLTKCNMLFWYTRTYQWSFCLEFFELSLLCCIKSLHKFNFDFLLCIGCNMWHSMCANEVLQLDWQCFMCSLIFVQGWGKLFNSFLVFEGVFREKLL
jgi:hypothetical protein